MENSNASHEDGRPRPAPSTARRLMALATPNRALLPLKLALFFYGASAFSILPYLTIHMKDIGISVS